MRQITSQITRAFVARQPAKGRNTRTDGFSIWLFEKEIARRSNSAVEICIAGWPTNTTLDRLNGLLDRLNATFRLCRHNHQVCAFPVTMGGHRGLGRNLKPKDWPRLDHYEWIDIKTIEMALNNRTFKELDAAMNNVAA